MEFSQSLFFEIIEKNTFPLNWHEYGTFLRLKKTNNTFQFQLNVNLPFVPQSVPQKKNDMETT